MINYYDYLLLKKLNYYFVSITTICCFIFRSSRGVGMINSYKKLMVLTTRGNNYRG